MPAGQVATITLRMQAATRQTLSRCERTDRRGPRDCPPARPKGRGGQSSTGLRYRGARSRQRGQRQGGHVSESGTWSGLPAS